MRDTMSTKKPIQPTTQDEDGVLRRMLTTPPKQHKSPKQEPTPSAPKKRPATKS